MADDAIFQGMPNSFENFLAIYNGTNSNICSNDNDIIEDCESDQYLSSGFKTINIKIAENTRELMTSMSGN